uniref:Uncharacterized protein n=1 Tax=Lactuca sativa TaxID=4236 RepID=A0A9R1VZU5_LACSA|nr:hypothetical protein LSAT_V11C400191590 [Lactuca sativa]
MALVSNLQEFNMYIDFYPYYIKMILGKLIWDFTYIQMCIVFDKIGDHLTLNAPIIRSRHTYTLQGFVYAFKIWILETFPNNSLVGSLIPGVIPRVVAYPTKRHLHALDCPHYNL